MGLSVCLLGQGQFAFVVYCGGWGGGGGFSCVLLATRQSAVIELRTSSQYVCCRIGVAGVSFYFVSSARGL